MYHTKSSGVGNFKIPLSKIVSPPGVKTRARRSSIYHKGGGRLVSPRNLRTRRTSVYVPSISNTDTVNVFSKVWATPARQPEPISENSPEKVSQKKAITVKRSPSSKKSGKTPKDVNRSASKSLECKTESPMLVQRKSGKTPKSTKKCVSPIRSSASKSKNSLSSTPTPKSVKKSRKPRITNASPSPSKKPKSPVSVKGKMPVCVPITSTPNKSLKQITGKSFYATPGETPIPSERVDDVFVFSAKPVMSAKKTAKKSVNSALVETPQKKATNTPKRMPLRKTPAVKRNRPDDSTDVVSSPVASPAAKRVKATPVTRAIKSVKKPEKKLSPVDGKASTAKLRLSPVQMSTVLKSVVKTEKRKASRSPSPRPTKQAKMSATSQQLNTPRVIKTVKRKTPKKLVEIVMVSQNTNNNTDNDESTGSMSLLNDTINTDSRSGRCVIL